MKAQTSILVLLWFLSVTTRLTAQPQMVLLPDEAKSGRRVVWSTEPGIRYGLQVSGDLNDPLAWETVEGFPTEAQALAQQYEIEQMAGDRQFYRVVQLDEQPPAISRRLPANESFGVQRFGDLRIELEDAMGILPSSIQLTVGSHGPFTLADDELSLQDGTLIFWLGGDTALGAWGETIAVALVVADTLGNQTQINWSFELETETQTAENVFVFGSPDAQRAGQRLQGSAAALAARFQTGPVRMGDGDLNWSIQEVTENAIRIHYEGTPPVFTEGQKLANRAPANSSEIFYRQVESVVLNTETQIIELGTVELGLADMIVQGAFSIPENPILLEMDENGTLVRSLEIAADFGLPALGADLSGIKLFRLTDEGVEVQPDQTWDEGLQVELAIEVQLDEGRIMYTPNLHMALSTSLGSVDRFEVSYQGHFETACVPRIEASVMINRGFEHTVLKHSHWIFFMAGPIPVGIEIELSVKVEGKLELGSVGTLRGGFRQEADIGIGATYQRDAVPMVTWQREFDLPPMEKVPFTYSLGGTAGAQVALVPQVDVRVYGVAGIYVKADPRLEVAGTATVHQEQIVSASWSLGAFADMTAGLSIRGIETEVLPSLPPFRLFTFGWEETFDLNPPPQPPITITLHPASQSAKTGDTVRFNMDASGPENLSFQWYQNGLPILGQTQKHLDLPRIRSGHGGVYHAVARANGQQTQTQPATLTLITTNNTGPAPAGMVRVQGGTLNTTNSLNGTHVSTFFIGRTEVTWGEWQTVRAWGEANGYDWDGPDQNNREPSGCADSHPVRYVSWYDAVKWCNAKSEMEGLPPVYWDNDEVYKTGEINPSHNFTANGYRLPFGAEWEFAARGGNQTNGYTFSGSNDLTAVGWFSGNSDGADCDMVEARGTWPVGLKAPNELGLYDMSGNVWEWCWDGIDHRRHQRGGSFTDHIFHCMVSYQREYDSWSRFSLTGPAGIRIARNAFIGVNLATAMISGHIWSDLNNNGTYSDESLDVDGLAGVSISVQSVDTGQIMGTVVSGPGGFFSVSDLNAGMYSIKIDQTTVPSTVIGFTTPTEYVVQILPGYNFQKADFGCAIRSPNLFVNGDFEEPLTTGWSGSTSSGGSGGASRIENENEGGGMALYLQRSLSNYEFETYQTIQADKDTEIRFDAKLEGASSIYGKGWAQVIVRLYNSAGEYLGAFVVSSTSGGLPGSSSTAKYFGAPDKNWNTYTFILSDVIDLYLPGVNADEVKQLKLSGLVHGTGLSGSAKLTLDNVWAEPGE
ncbi:MAG: SUMF1/EgtB/PvdO family nonheme iron enzyme [Kiritimatiellia bacterium]